MPPKLGVSAVEKISLTTDVETTGIDLDVLPGWQRQQSVNPAQMFLHQTDWSGGCNQKLIPNAAEIGNMYWTGQVWTANNYEMRPGPLRRAFAGTALNDTAVENFVEFNDTLYFSSGTEKYSVSTGSPLTIQPDATAGQDTYIQSSTPTTNYGTNTRLLIGEYYGGEETNRALIKFDLTNLPSDATIVSAVLSLYCTGDYSNTARTFRVYRLKRAWVESQATWNAYSTGNNWSTAGGFHADDCEQTAIGSRAFAASETLNEFKNFSLTPTTKANLDLGNGWLIKADTESDDEYGFKSSDWVTAAQRPKLVITYTPSAPVPTEVDAGGTAAVTDIQVVGTKLYVCLGPNAIMRTFDGTTWGADATSRKARTIYGTADDVFWAGNAATPTGKACFLYWTRTGVSGTGSMQIGKINTNINAIVAMPDITSSIFVLKDEGLFHVVKGSTNDNWRQERVVGWPPNPKNGRTGAFYNKYLYYAANGGLWRWTGKGVPEAVPMPEMMDEGQVGWVWALYPCVNGLLVGTVGYLFWMIEEQGIFWWHYVAKNTTSKRFGALFFTSGLGLTRPRLFIGFQTDTTNNLQYIDFCNDVFIPYEYETGTSAIMQGIYSGPELYPVWYKDIIMGGRNLDANKTIQWATTPDLSSYTDFGSAVTANGFSTVTPSANTSGYKVHFRVTFTTNVTTTPPILDFWRIEFRHRPPSKRAWIFQVLGRTGASHPGGGRAVLPIDILTALVAARNQANPCTLSVPSEGVENVPVFIDLVEVGLRADVRKQELSKAVFTLRCIEA